MATTTPGDFLSKQDLEYIQGSGRDPEKVSRQLHRFVTGFPPMALLRPVSPGDGLFSVEYKKAYTILFEQEALHRRICKFVPASGAASRMFKLLYAFISDPGALHETEVASIEHLCEHLSGLALYTGLKASLAQAGYRLDELVASKQFTPIIRHLLTEEGLDYGNLPKALLAFHQYDGYVRTALDEHLVEAANYCQSAEEKVYVHFTVSEQHQALVAQHLEAVLPHYEDTFGCVFDVSTSIQRASTDTPAVDLENRPFRNEQGQLLFRPGGHGALLENLNSLDADWVFIKNIDNVVPDRLKAETYRWKKIIGGILADVQQQVFSRLEQLDRTGELSEVLTAFMEDQLNIVFPSAFDAWSDERRLAFVRARLNRPVRVCGVISTEENTGGGPFWVKNEQGGQSLQLVETAQIDLENAEQKAIVKQSTYANITDLVCGLRDYKGNRFDLLQFRDDETGFITQKSVNGKPLKAMELPGLWNGAMADWNTILVEVLSSTFNPVKSVFDLLEPEHST